MTMTTDRKTAIAAGVLFLIATVSYVIGSAVITSAVQSPDHVSNLNSNQIGVGALLEFIDAASVVAIGVLLFPILRTHSERMALGYVGSRIIESVLVIVSVLGILLLPVLSQQYQQAGPVDGSQIQSLGTLATEWYNLAFQMAMIALGLGSLALCYVLYRFRLVPRALSAFGVVGYVALLASGWLEIFGSNIGFVLFAPGAIFEVVFPVWLIVKGLDEPAVTAGLISPNRRGVMTTTAIETPKAEAGVPGRA